MELNETVSVDLQKIRDQKPLLHHITNMVVMNETANATLCLGALPVMAHSDDEVEEMVTHAGALVLNIGTLYPQLIKSMIRAGRQANEIGVPVVLDPVGVGATKLRTDSAKEILKELNIDVVRGNAAEVSILGGFDGEIKGVESMGGSSDLISVSKEFAEVHGCTVAITGEVDIVSDKNQTLKISNGDKMLGLVTGTGCMATTIIGGFAAVQEDKSLAAAGALAMFGLAGELAAGDAGNRPGSFHVALYDRIFMIQPSDIKDNAKIEIVS